VNIRFRNTVAMYSSNDGPAVFARNGGATISDSAQKPQLPTPVCRKSSLKTKGKNAPDSKLFGIKVGASSVLSWHERLRPPKHARLLELIQSNKSYPLHDRLLSHVALRYVVCPTRSVIYDTCESEPVVPF
jgi:hypothetical protein